jgi:hypothetical protein
LGADKVDLEFRAQGIAPPGDAMRLGAGLAEQGIVQGETQRSLLAQRFGDAAAHAVEQILGGNAALGKQPVSRRPILKLQATSGQQAGDGSASQAQQRTQREGLRPLVDSLLGAAGLALAPELLEAVEEERRVFFRTGGGAWGRRSASRDLSSMSHSTVSPRANSMACATAEGKLMYHCSLALRLMSWTLVGKPMGTSTLVIQLDHKKCQEKEHNWAEMS